MVSDPVGFSGGGLAMVAVKKEGAWVNVIPRVRVDWGELENLVREQVPLEQILQQEKIC